MGDFIGYALLTITSAIYICMVAADHLRHHEACQAQEEAKKDEHKTRTETAEKSLHER